jgi:4-diphosphocytidyl-2-C-methyl-D-erythritol kinase
MIRTASLKAYAKLNLGLRVLFKRPDGYHELRTVFQTISLADSLEISFRRAATTRIRIAGTPEIAENLVEKAAVLALEAMRIQADVRFTLKKCIPAGAGLGGGSSDAAAVLLALPALAGKNLSLECLGGLAAQVGSDVSFFLYGGTALGLGRGEEIYPLPDRRRARGLLVAPAIHCSTAEAYKDLSQRLTSIALQNKVVTFQEEVWREAGSPRKETPHEAPTAVNDFEEGVFDRHPELRRIRNRLRSSGARSAAMTGSGSAIFGIFDNPGQLQQARKSFNDGRTFAISFVSRSRYRASWLRALRLHTKGDLWPPRSLYAR